MLMERWRRSEQGECRAFRRLEAGTFCIENFGEVGWCGRMDAEESNGPCSPRAKSHTAETHGGEDQLPANTYALKESSTAIGVPVRGGDAGHSRSFDRRLAHQTGHQPRELKFSFASDCVRGLTVDSLALTGGQRCCLTSMLSAGSAP
jgi:hypothetical protein